MYLADDEGCEHSVLVQGVAKSLGIKTKYIYCIITTNVIGLIHFTYLLKPDEGDTINIGSNVPRDLYATG